MGTCESVAGDSGVNGCLHRSILGSSWGSPLRTLLGNEGSLWGFEDHHEMVASRRSKRENVKVATGTWACWGWLGPSPWMLESRLAKLEGGGKTLSPKHPDRVLCSLGAPSCPFPVL